jgi:prepilin-type N-terminal cleavage/methylation domain-containing protein
MWNRQCSDHSTGRPLARNRRGFTLIELLLVIVIIGLLSAITIPKFANTKQKAIVASMKSDLRNLASAEEGYWVENRTYYGAAIPGATFLYQPTQGVTVTMITASGAGWSATAAAPGSTLTTCAIFYGDALPLPPATTEGAPACT